MSRPSSHISPFNLLNLTKDNNNNTRILNLSAALHYILITSFLRHCKSINPLSDIVSMLLLVHKSQTLIHLEHFVRVTALYYYYLTHPLGRGLSAETVRRRVIFLDTVSWRTGPVKTQRCLAESPRALN